MKEFYLQNLQNQSMPNSHEKTGVHANRYDGNANIKHYFESKSNALE